MENVGLLDDRVTDVTPYVGRDGYTDNKGVEVAPVAPQLCAVTGQKAPAGRPATDVHLGNGIYYRILAKAKHLADKPAIAQKLEKGMSTLKGKQPTVVVKEEKKS
jgi:hypothetical protein